MLSLLTQELGLSLLRFRESFMLRHFKRPRRVVITGMGCVTPIGIGREAFWSGLQNGLSGVRRIESFG